MTITQILLILFNLFLVFLAILTLGSTFKKIKEEKQAIERELAIYDICKSKIQK